MTQIPNQILKQSIQDIKGRFMMIFLKEKRKL